MGMIMTTRFETFEAFWPYYLQQHASEDTRLLHYFGTAMTFPMIAGLVVSQDYRWLFAALIVAYASAWLGHAIFEKNRPATFTYPGWSLRADFRMFRLWLFGRLNRELALAGVPTTS
jgi:hypothetical protein